MRCPEAKPTNLIPDLERSCKMPATRVCLLGLIVLLLGVSASVARDQIPEATQAILDKATEYEVYSLDPTPGDAVKDGFHGWKVLGKTTVKADKRKGLLDALAKGIKDNKGEAAKCFIPRHGIRATHDGKSVDLVICFQCLQIYVFHDKSDKHDATILTTATPQEAFDKVLKDAGIKLAEKAKE
jgi:hypothetical protein